MKTALTTLALAAALAQVAPASADEMVRGRPHSAYLAMVSTYKPMQGFNHVVGSKRFVGYFLRNGEVCAVTVISAVADDQRLETPPQRVQIDIPAAGRSELLAGNGDALGIGCVADASEIRVAPLLARPSKAASN
jgi:hypothetical protein